MILAPKSSTCARAFVLTIFAILLAQNLLAKDWDLRFKGYSSPKWLSSDDIVYIKNETYQEEGSYPWDYPFRYVVEICKRSIESTEEKVLLHVAHTVIDRPKRQYRIFDDKKLEGATGIWDIDVSLTTKMIAFGLTSRKDYKDSPEPIKAGIYIIDVDGKNFKYISPGYRPKFSPDGARILFGTADPEFLKNMNIESNSALFVHDLETGQNRLVTKEKYDIYKWDSDNQSIVLDFKDKANKYFLYSLKNGFLTEITYENAKNYSYDKKYWSSSEGDLYFKDENSKVQKIKAPIPFPNLKFKEWNPSRLQYLAEDDRDILGKLITVDAPTMKVTTILEESQ